jgi:hypothetical protein
MQWLRYHEDLSDCPEAAVAVRAIDAAQRHVGLYYRDTDGTVLFMHLAWHHSLCCQDPPDESCRWVAPALDDAVLSFLATVCRAIRSEEPSLPYGFGQGRFDPDAGTFQQNGVRRGLTCATFVVAVFAAYDIQLVALDSWPQRSEDSAWQAKILRILEKRAESEHVEAIRRDVGHCVRIRPEEVAAAASFAVLPADFDDVAPRGIEIVDALT